MEETNLKDFSEQIKKGLIEVINEDILIIKNYPYGFQKCIMTFKKSQNRNGQIIERTSEINGKISKPKKTTASRINIFIYDKELKRHFILSVHGLSLTIYTTQFKCSNLIYNEYYYNLIDGKSFDLLKFFKPYLNMTEEVYNKIIKINVLKGVEE